jgi:hypothetical protein
VLSRDEEPGRQDCWWSRGGEWWKEKDTPTSRNDLLEAVQLSLKENIKKHSFKNSILHAKLVALCISYVPLLPVQFGPMNGTNELII